MTSSSSRVRRGVLAGLLGLLVAGGGVAGGPGAGVAYANPNELALEILPDPATLAPDGRSLSFGITTECDRRAAILDARADATQPQASGQGSFTPICNRLPNFLEVTVPVTSGTFRTGSAQVSAVMVVREGRSKRVTDTATVEVRPSVAVRSADRAALAGGGATVLLDVTVTCPAVSNSRGGQVTIYQNGIAGTGTFAPVACDGLPHTSSVTVVASSGLFQAGAADALASATVEVGGEIFPGLELRTIQIS